MYCENCSKTVPGGAVYCPHCGNKVQKKENKKIKNVPEKGSVKVQYSHTAMVWGLVIGIAAALNAAMYIISAYIAHVMYGTASWAMFSLTCGLIGLLIACADKAKDMHPITNQVSIVLSMIGFVPAIEIAIKSLF